MSVSNFDHRRLVRSGMMATVGAGSLLLLAACGGGSSTASSAAPSVDSSTAAPVATGSPAGHRMPSVNGQITGINGEVLQLQNSTGQQTVSWNNTTTLEQLVSATQSDIAVGKCVQVRDPGAGSDGTAAAADPTQPVAAAAVVISDAVNGTCMRGIGGGRAAGGDSGVGAGASRMHGALRGIVASISGNTITVTPVTPADASAAPAGSTTRTVALSPTTAYTQVGPASATDLTVGKCVSAFGAAANSGTPAQTIIVRPATNSTCGSGPAGTSAAPATGGDASGTASAAPMDNSSGGTAPADSSTNNSGN